MSYLNTLVTSKGISWPFYLENTLGIKRSTGEKIRSMWNHMAPFPVFQRLTLPWSTVSLYAVSVCDYLKEEGNEEERAFWAGPQHPSCDKGKGKQVPTAQNKETWAGRLEGGSGRGALQQEGGSGNGALQQEGGSGEGALQQEGGSGNAQSQGTWYRQEGETLTQQPGQTRTKKGGKERQTKSTAK